MRLRNFLQVISDVNLVVVASSILLLLAACRPAGLPAPGTPIVLNPTLIIIAIGTEEVTAADTSALPQTPVLPSETEGQLGAVTSTPTHTPTPTPVDTTPRVTANASAVNLRTGPGTNYCRVGDLLAGQSLENVARNANSSCWQVVTGDGLRYIAASVIAIAPTGPASLRPTSTSVAPSVTSPGRTET